MRGYQKSYQEIDKLQNDYKPVTQTINTIVKVVSSCEQH